MVFSVAHFLGGKDILFTAKIKKTIVKSHLRGNNCDSDLYRDVNALKLYFGRLVF